ncbi:MAG: hypothetical protein VKI83_10885, partial [Synechococcaceae cyanobacterium]|nr:hypothetical protein [Synechococcaceae cyanobacterium]
YEDLCRDPDGTLGALADWLGLEPPMAAAAGGGPDAAAPELPRQPVSGFLPAYTRHQHGLIGSRPRSDRIDAWRGQLQSWQQADLEEQLGELMTMLGYPPDPQPAGGQRQAGLWRRQLQPLLRRLQGRLRHRWRQRLHSGGLG